MPRACGGSLLIVCLLAGNAAAQTVRPGTVALSGGTGVSVDRVTASATGLGVGASATVVTISVEAIYYLGSYFGIGGVASHQGVSMAAPAADAKARLTAAAFGPLAQVRAPLGPRLTLALVASFGGTSVTVINQHTGFATDQSISAVGQYWLAGGALSVGLKGRITLDAGVRYQRARFAGPPGSPNTIVAGLLASATFSVYLGS